MSGRTLGLHVALAGLLVLAAGLGAGQVLFTAPAAQTAYEKALLDFLHAERLLVHEVDRLIAGTSNHFDTLNVHARALRAADAALGALPPLVETHPALHELRVRLSVQLNERMAHLEDFKTLLATSQVAGDRLPAHLDLAERDGLAAGPEGQTVLARAAMGLALYMRGHDESAEAQVRADLAALAALAGESGSPSYQPGFGALARHGAAFVDYRRSLNAVARQMADVPLATQAQALATRYREIRNERAWQRALVTSVGAGIALLLAYGAAMGLLWRARRAVAALDQAREEMRATLKEARLQQASGRSGAMEEGVRLAEERHRALVAHAFDIMAVLSREENYIHVSPASRTIYGLTEKEMIGKSVYEGIHADDIIKLQDYLTRAQRELQTEQTIQYRVMDAYGRWHLVESFASNQASNPAVRGMVLNTRRIGPAGSARA